MRKISVVYMVSLCAVILSACSFAQSETSLSVEEKQLKTKIEQGRDKLLGYQSYMISSESSGSLYSTSLISRNGDTQYVEYPMTDEGEVEWREFTAGGKYGLSEYRMADGTWFSFNGDSCYRMPDSYGIYRDDLRVMYIDRLLEGAYDLSEGTDFAVTTVNGELILNSITFKSDSLALRDTLGNPEYASYQSSYDKSTDAAVKNYSNILLNELTSTFYTQDVDCIALLDNNGVLRGVAIKGRGGGSYLYNQSVVVNLDNTVIREEPDVSSNISFLAQMTNIGTLVAGAETYDEVLGILNDLGSETGGDNIEEEVSQP